MEYPEPGFEQRYQGYPYNLANNQSQPQFNPFMNPMMMNPMMMNPMFNPMMNPMMNPTMQGQGVMPMHPPFNQQPMPNPHMQHTNN